MVQKRDFNLKNVHYVVFCLNFHLEIGLSINKVYALNYVYSTHFHIEVAWEFVHLLNLVTGNFFGLQQEPLEDKIQKHKMA